MTRTSRNSLSRRKFITNTSQAAVGSLVAAGAWMPGNPASGQGGDAIRQATGTRVGEVTDTEAIVWTRLTANAARNNQGLNVGGRVNRNNPVAVTVPVEQLEGACPGAAGRVRLRYGTREDLSDATDLRVGRRVRGRRLHPPVPPQRA